MMAWIKMRHELLTEIEVIQLADMLNVREETVVGYLFAVWVWFDKHTEDGVASLSPSMVERVLRLPGFCDAMVQVGWLEHTEIDGMNTLKMPDFDTHNSESAKRRAVKTRQKQGERARNGVSPSCRQNVAKRGDKTATREEKRREDKSSNKPPNPQRGKSKVVDPMEVFPDQFSGDASVESAYREWFEYKSERGQRYRSLKGPNAVASMLTDIGAQRFKAAVSHSIRNNYSGLYEPGQANGRQSESTNQELTESLLARSSDG